MNVRRTVVSPPMSDGVVSTTAAANVTADLRAAGLKDAVRRWQQKNAVKPGNSNENSSLSEEATSNTVSRPVVKPGGTTAALKRDVTNIQSGKELVGKGGANPVQTSDQPPTKMLKTSPATVHLRQQSLAKTATQSAVVSAVRGIAERTTAAKNANQNQTTFNGPMSFEEIMRAKKGRSQAAAVRTEPPIESSSPSTEPFNSSSQDKLTSAVKQTETTDDKNSVQLRPTEQDKLIEPPNITEMSPSNNNNVSAHTATKEVVMPETPNLRATVSVNTPPGSVDKGLKDETSGVDNIIAPPNSTDIVTLTEKSPKAAVISTDTSKSVTIEIKDELNEPPTEKLSTILTDVTSPRTAVRAEEDDGKMIVSEEKSVTDESDESRTDMERKLITAIATDNVWKTVTDEDRRFVEEQITELCGPILKCETWKDMRKALDKISSVLTTSQSTSVGQSVGPKDLTNQSAG